MTKTFIISEIGINHNGDLDIAKRMIDASKHAGADAVKFQKRDVEMVYSKEQLKKPRTSPFGTTEREQKEGLEFSENEYDIIDNYCKEKKITWFASAWDMNSLEFLDKYDFKYHKIASAMILDTTFLNEVAKRKKHTFISTGMSDFNMIDSAVEIFEKNKCSFELMHCISAYPFDSEIANLNMIKILRDRYKFEKIYGNQFIGCWYDLDKQDICRLDNSKDTIILGDNFVLGKKFWDQTGGIKLTIKNLSWARFNDFLPFGNEFLPMKRIIQRYLSSDIRVQISMSPIRNEIKNFELSSRSETRLGFSSWLKPRKTKIFQEVKFQFDTSHVS